MFNKLIMTLEAKLFMTFGECSF